MIFLYLNTQLLQSNASTGSHIAEIIAMLAGAFIFGYLVRHFMNEKFKRRIRELEAEVAGLKNKITALEANNAELSMNLDNAITRTIKLGNELTHTSEKLEKSENTNTQLTADLNTANHRINLLNEAAAITKKTMTGMEATNNKLTTEIKELSEKLAKLATEDNGGNKTKKPAK
ncbi:MAG: hypothetical protein ACHQFW_11930 [Chitinophagales bacterium]